MNTAKATADMGRVQMSNPAIQETIRITMQRLSKNGKAGITKKHILKVLFLIKEHLPDYNHIKEGLAYYWYKDGPYSEVVCANLDHMVTDGLLKMHRSETYRFVPERAMQPIVSGANLNDAKREIDHVASKFYNASAAIKRIEMAPFKWYITYNLEFKSQFENYCKNALVGRKGVFTDRDMLDRLDDIVLDYPTIPEFMEHRMAFMDFAKIVNAFLRRDLDHIPNDTLRWIPGICSEIWTTFAYGVRVYHHDRQYDGHVGKWTEMYGTALQKLEHEIANRMEQFGDVGVDEPDLAPEIKDMTLYPERHEFTPLSLDEIVQNG